MNSKKNIVFDEIKEIIKNKFNKDVFDISKYNLMKVAETIKKMVDSNNKKMILYSDNKEVYKFFCLSSGMMFNNINYIIFYYDDFLTFNNNNYKEVVGGQMLNKIINGVEDDEKCSVCYNNYEMMSGFSVCISCGSKICVKCLLKLNNNNCVICRKENAY